MTNEGNSEGWLYHGGTDIADVAERYDTFVLPEQGIRCVSDRPWVTAAETCECAMALLGVGENEKALDLFTWAQKLREDDGRYITGMVHPQLTTFPPDERSTYSSACASVRARRSCLSRMIHRLPRGRTGASTSRVGRSCETSARRPDRAREARGLPALDGA